MMLRLFSLAGFLAALVATAYAADQDCSKALVIDSKKIDHSFESELSLAYKLSEAQWSQKRTEFGANFEIEGVPLGANYSDFQNNVTQKAEQFHLSRFEKRADSYATSSLDEYSLDAYKACLESSGKGFYLLAGAGSEATYEVHLFNQPPPGTDPQIKGVVRQPINISSDRLADLKETVSALALASSWDQHVTLQPIDPKKEMSFGVKFGAASSKDLILPPLDRAPAKVDLMESGVYSLFHRVKGMTSQDCAAGVDGASIGNFQPGYVMYKQACLSTGGQHLPSNFRIRSESVSVISPQQACGRVTCFETNQHDAENSNGGVVDATQCKSQKGLRTDYCFNILVACPNAYDVGCTQDWKITGEAIEVK